MIQGTGIDITEVRRIKQAVEKWGDSFLNRVFTQKELLNAQSRGSLYQYLAGRFAAKEAVFKAMGDKTLGWKDIQILNKPDGKPYCTILNNNKMESEILLSISHVKYYAVANAIIKKKTQRP